MMVKIANHIIIKREKYKKKILYENNHDDVILQTKKYFLHTGTSSLETSW